APPRSADCNNARQRLRRRQSYAPAYWQTDGQTRAPAHSWSRNIFEQTLHSRSRDQVPESRYRFLQSRARSAAKYASRQNSREKLDIRSLPSPMAPYRESGPAATSRRLGKSATTRRRPPLLASEQTRRFAVETSGSAAALLLFGGSRSARRDRR